MTTRYGPQLRTTPKRLWKFAKPVWLVGLLISAVACPLTVITFGASPEALFLIACTAGTALFGPILMFAAGPIIRADPSKWD